MFRRFFQIYTSPTKVFDDIRDSKVSWWQPWIFTSILFIIGGWLAMPAQHAVMMLNPKITPDMADKMGKAAYFQLIIAPAMVLLIGLIAGGISYVVVTLQAKEATFKKYFTLILFTQLIYALGYVIVCAILRARGTEGITSPEDVKISFSLRMLAPEANPVVRGLLASIEFFSLWGLVLTAMGLKRIFNLRTGQAVACIIPLWLIYAVLSIVGEVFSKMGGG
ncbi:MAG TPA: YIP1 family protein [Candidatus Krumholzibacteria bacterium]|nr:YIP1 family protein [Candidatus Krumholzibacteria bacterium]